MIDGLRVVDTGLKPDDKVIVNGLQKVFMPGMPVAPKVVAMREGARARAEEKLGTPVSEAELRDRDTASGLAKKLGIPASEKHPAGRIERSGAILEILAPPDDYVSAKPGLTCRLQGHRGAMIDSALVGSTQPGSAPGRIWAQDPLLRHRCPVQPVRSGRPELLGGHGTSATRGRARKDLQASGEV